MKVVIRNTESGYVVGQYDRIITKAGNEVSVFEPLPSYTAVVNPMQITVTGPEGTRIHKLWPKDKRVVSEANGRESVQIADAVWLNRDSHDVTYISTYAQSGPTEFCNIEL